jgi:glycerophosphoryl diester phosphodiesterase
MPTSKNPTFNASRWPYPFWIAHRGAGKLAPENTLAAFRLGASHGYRMFECDVKLSADGVAFLLHDDTLERTSDGLGMAGDLPWHQLAELDAGAWHSSHYAGEPLPSLGQVARFCLANQYCLNIEIKPTPGSEAETGRALAQVAQSLWSTAAPAQAPLLTSFQTASLEAAQKAAPQLRRGLLLEELWPGWQQAAIELDCQALICDHSIWSAELRREVRSMGLRALAYTVNEPEEVQRLLDLQLDGIITDRVDRFNPVG